MASTVLWAFVLLLPLDIANSRGEGSGFNIQTAYVILFIIYLCFLVFILPFVSFFYDTDSENSCGARFFKSLIYTLLMILIVGILGVIAWGIVNNAKIKVTQKVAYISALQYKDEQTTTDLTQASYSVDNSIPYQPNVLLIAIIFILFLGWFIFIIFGGIGLISLPMDLIIDYIYR
jgi:LMBR1 domain-containing protein 1